MTIHALTILISAVIIAFSPGHAPRTQVTGIEVAQRVEYEFGHEVDFTAQVTSPIEVNRAALFLRSHETGQTDVHLAEPSPLFENSQIARVSLPGNQFPPFERMTYWWQIDLKDGQSHTTDPAVFNYDDNRQAWDSIETDRFYIAWAGEDSDFGRATLTFAESSLTTALQILSSAPPDQIRIFIYPSIREFRDIEGVPDAYWIGGFSVPSSNSIIIPVEGGAESVLGIERTLPHELTHLLLHQRMGERYSNLPAWLNEGLATLQEGFPDPSYRIALEQAAREGMLLPLESLCRSFPFSGEQALLAYAQSASFVEYLRDIYGTGGISTLLDTYREGATCAGGVQRVFQRPIELLENEWVEYRFEPAFFDRVDPWILAPILLVIIASLAWTVRTLRRKSRSGDTVR